MRSAFIVSAFAALALAAPRPQDIEFDQVDASPDPIVVAVPVDVAEQTVTLQPLAAVTTTADASVTDVASTEQKRDFLGVARSLSKRHDGDCSAQPAGTGPAVSKYVSLPVSK
jgi:ribonuclease PH